MRGAFLIWMSLGLSLLSGEGGAQVNGVIADSIVGRRVPGAVITVFDSARNVLTRGLADDSGRFRIDNLPAARRIRVVKIGYRPAELRVTQPASLRVMLERLPNLLEPVRTSDQPRCSRNPTRPAAFGLWEQARAALLGAVIAREQNTAMVTRLNFRRYFTQPAADGVALMSVRRDSGFALRPFEASFPADVFMRTGFAQPLGNGRIQYYGPDAEVLLSEALVDHYCLEIANASIDRPTQVGLRFRPMGRERGRVDVDGTLWIDTLARKLTDIEYGYLGLESWATRWQPGGRIGFVETSPAALWIDRWTIRMTGARIDSGQRLLPDYTRRPLVVEGGSELARARWPDGRAWEAALGTAEITLTSRGGVPLAGARMRLDSTDYGGVSDSVGRVRVHDLLPGPYRISVFDSTLAVVDTALPASTGFVAERGRVTSVGATVPTLREFVTSGCLEQDAFNERSEMLVARIVIADDSVPAAAVKWRLELAAGEEDLTIPDGILANGMTGREGLIFVCNRLHADRRVVLRVWSPAARSDDSGTAVTFLMRPRVIKAVRLAIPR